MFCIGLDTHKENTHAIVLDDKTGQKVWEGSFSSTLRGARVLEPFFTKGTRVAIEATSCFYPLYDGLQDKGVDVRVVNTVRLRKPAIKTDKRDAHRIAHLLRRDELPTAFIPGKKLRLQRELCSLRVRFVQACTRCKNRIHAILHKEGKRPFGVKDIFSKKGREQLEKMKEVLDRKDELGDELDLLEIYERKLARVEEQIHRVIEGDEELKKQVELIDSIPGFAETLAFVCATEIGPIRRFESPKSLVAYAGMHPCIDSSGGKIRHGRIRRVGRKLFRWALVEAAHSAGNSKTPLGKYYRKKRRRKKSGHAAAIATANKLARVIYHVLSKEKVYNPARKK